MAKQAQQLPEGFSYRADFLTAEEHEALLRTIEPLGFEAFSFRVTPLNARSSYTAGTTTSPRAKPARFKDCQTFSCLCETKWRLN